MRVYTLVIGFAPDTFGKDYSILARNFPEAYRKSEVILKEVRKNAKEKGKEIIRIACESKITEIPEHKEIPERA